MDKKNVIIEGEETSYFIYRDGRLWNSETNNFYKGKIRNGYRWFDLRWRSKKYTKSQHRLLAEAFLPNEQIKECVSHKDGNRLNNCLENLQWCSHPEDSSRIGGREKQNVTLPFSFGEIGSEKWSPLRETVYLVSDYGRVRNSQTRKILKGEIAASGYREYRLMIKGKKENFQACQLVWEAFNWETSPKINHTNGNKLDDRLQNLETVNKRYHKTKTVQLDDEKNIVRIFSSDANAAKAMGVKLQSIQQAIVQQGKSCNYYWKNIS